MHRYFLIIGFFSLLSSFAFAQKWQSYTVTENSLSPVPLKPHQREIDVFFDAERPVKPYYKVKMIEVTANPLATADYLLLMLKEKTRQEGADAIMVSDIGRQLNGVINIPDEHGVTSYQKLVGIGVKYKERIDYMDRILKEQVISLWPDDNPAPKIFSMKFDFNGRNLSLNDPFVQQFFHFQIYTFEGASSIYMPDAEWEYNIDTMNQTFSKRRLAEDGTSLWSNFSLNESNSQEAFIKVVAEPYGKVTKFDLSMQFNQSGLLIGKRLRKRRPAADIWVEEIKYKLNGVPDKITRYQIVKGRKVVYFEIQNFYYSNEDLPATVN